MPAIPSFGGLRGRTNRVTPPTAPIPVPLSAYVVDCGVYVDGERLPGRWTHIDAVAEVRRRGEGFVWIGLHEPDERQIQGVAETFGLHELAVEDAVTAHQRPKLERYDDNLFMVLKTVRYVEHESPTTANEIVETGEIMAFLGADYVVTVRHGKHSGLHDLRAELERSPDRLRGGPAAVLHAIADHVVDTYLAVTDAFEGDIDLIEKAVFAPRSPVSAEQMYLMKREILELRRAVMPLANPLRRLAEGCSPLVPDTVRSYFRDVDDHLTTVSERVTSFDELLTTLVDATLAKITLQQNTDMRKITSWAAIIAVPTMVVGVYGMNFDHMPETHWRFGYPMVMAVIFVACIVLYRIFRKNRWL
ncbi:magnesium and cobalt transport protein CorA [Actinokineospora globicatena]|uniref:Magnesium transport protein CorA n=1 Tax=Actinokineospora globicatena TaxID=103729 RepID=A0A9W6QKD8_9PSEU|nr:magnesium and cobalt transport protein CorA [Actinokineospora globicatena]MCP2300418.1 magnesium transporter [Actinokineospora globicatena]GLW80951.1 magnesium transport protein CorA [Actinokineospora globicatena]GLW88144.1 magnesium transport protein CorA [Actinokineospora globicatena]GLW92626.1 magnesium transport protein CorA [Actinokineospora globicatena]